MAQDCGATEQSGGVGQLCSFCMGWPGIKCCFASCQANLELFSCLPLKTRKRSPSPSTPHTGRPCLHRSSPTRLNSDRVLHLCLWLAASAVLLMRTGQFIKAFCTELMSSKGSREKDALPEETKSLNGHLEKAHSEEKVYLKQLE